MSLTVVNWISWVVFLNMVSEDGANTFFETSSLQDELENEFKCSGEHRFIRTRNVSEDEWKDYVSKKYDAAYMTKIAGARERLASQEGEGENEGKAGDGRSMA